MNGVLVLDARSGALLGSHLYTKNFGLSEDVGGRRDAAGDLDTMGLASMLFALHVNSRAVFVPPSGGGGGGAEKENCGQQGGGGGAGVGLQMYSTGDCTLFFSHDEGAGVLTVTVAESRLGEDVGFFVADLILQRFCEKFGSSLAKRAKEGHSARQRKFKGLKGLVEKALLEVPGRLAHAMLAEVHAAARPPWLFVTLSEAFVADMDWDDFLLVDRKRAGLAGLSKRRSSAPVALPSHSSGGGAATSSSSSSVVGPSRIDLSVAPAGAAPPAAPIYNQGEAKPRRSNIARVALRPKAKKWWNLRDRAAASFSALGPLQHLYVGDPAGAVAAEELSVEVEGQPPGQGAAPWAAGGAVLRLEPKPAMLSSLLALANRAGKVMSSVSDVADQLQSMEAVVREPAAEGWEGGQARQTKVTLIRIEEFVVAFPSATREGLSPSLLASMHPELERLRLLFLFFQARGISLEAVV